MISRRSFLRLVGMGSVFVAFLWTPIKRLVSFQTQTSQSVIQEASLELDLEALNAEDTLFFAGRILHLDFSKRLIQVEIEGGKTGVFLIGNSSFLWKGGEVPPESLSPGDVFFAQVFPTEQADVFLIKYLWANIVNFYGRLRALELAKQQMYVWVEGPEGERQVIVSWDSRTEVNEGQGFPSTQDAMKWLSMHLKNRKEGIPIQVLGVSEGMYTVRATRIWFSTEVR